MPLKLTCRQRRSRQKPGIPGMWNPIFLLWCEVLTYQQKVWSLITWIWISSHWSFRKINIFPKMSNWALTEVEEKFFWTVQSALRINCKVEIIRITIKQMYWLHDHIHISLYWSYEWNSIYRFASNYCLSNCVFLLVFKWGLILAFSSRYRSHWSVLNAGCRSWENAPLLYQQTHFRFQLKQVWPNNQPLLQTIKCWKNKYKSNTNTDLYHLQGKGD